MNPMQQYYDAAAHEAGHACGLLWYGIPVLYVDMERDGRSRARVAPGGAESEPIPEEVKRAGVDAVLRWARPRDVRELQHHAIATRLASLMGGQAWDSLECSHDRSLVAELCPSGRDAALWEQMITIDAEFVAGDRKFQAGCRRIANLLADRYYGDVMPGEEVAKHVADAHGIFDKEQQTS